MKVAVTGAGGFIGRHVTAAMKARGISPALVVRPGAALHEEHAGLRRVELDIHDAPGNAWEVMGRPDVLVHLAWGGLPNYKSAHHLEREAPAHTRFLEQLVRSGVKHVVVTGTCFEYGMRNGCVSEEMEPNPTNAYGIAKDTVRRHLAALQPRFPFALTWARLFYIYGEGQSPDTLFSKLKDAVKSGKQMFDMSGGEQLRDYLPAGEVADILTFLSTTVEGSGILNVCSGKPVSIRDLVAFWIRENGWDIQMNLGFYPYHDYEPMAFWGDRARLDATLANICSTKAAAVVGAVDVGS
jgi:nucleoside-diphosphate-sugar epimerase